MGIMGKYSACFSQNKVLASTSYSQPVLFTLALYFASVNSSSTCLCCLSNVTTNVKFKICKRLSKCKNNSDIIDNTYNWY